MIRFVLSGTEAGEPDGRIEGVIFSNGLVSVGANDYTCCTDFDSFDEMRLEYPSDYWTVEYIDEGQVL